MKTTINVKVNKEDLSLANNILKSLGLNMSTAINMFIKQIIKEDGIPFEIRNPRPSKELLEALQEGEQIEKELKEGKRTGYNNVNEMMKAILDD